MILVFFDEFLMMTLMTSSESLWFIVICRWNIWDSDELYFRWLLVMSEIIPLDYNCGLLGWCSYFWCLKNMVLLFFSCFFFHICFHFFCTPAMRTETSNGVAAIATSTRSHRFLRAPRNIAGCSAPGKMSQNQTAPGWNPKKQLVNGWWIILYHHTN